MEHFHPELETCPICGSTGNCHVHDYYGRSIIDFVTGKQQKSHLCVLRVFCENCQHAHAILPDIIIPYSSYGLFFILRILGEYFSRLYTIEQLCERFGVSQINSSNGSVFGKLINSNGLVFCWMLRLLIPLF